MPRLPSIVALTVGLAPTLAAADAPCVARDPVTAEINAREGIRMAKEEQYEAAEALFVTATRLDPCMPKYPYLLGRAHERQDELDEAEAAYRVVIERFPTSVEFTKAQGALLELDARRAQAAREAEEAALRAEAARKAEEARRAEAAREAEEARKAEEAARLALAGDPKTIGGRAEVDDTPWGTVGWLTAGVGLAAAGAGLGFALAARDADDELTLAATRPDRKRYDALVDDRETYATLGWVGYGVGAALVIGGLTLVLLDDGPAPAVAPTDGGAVMGLSGRF